MDYTNDDNLVDPLVDAAADDESTDLDAEENVEDEDSEPLSVYDMNADGELEEAA